MANSIAKQKGVSTVLDEVYAQESLTADLNTSGDLVRAGANAKEIAIPKVTVDGLGDYSRSAGYTQGSVTLTWETVEFNYDRGTRITVDAMDNEEANGVEPFVKAGSELERTAVVPEGDAFTFAQIVAGAGTGQDFASAGKTYSTAADILTDLSDEMAAMDDDSVSEGRILYITPTLLNKINAYNNNSGTIDKDEVMGKFSKVVKVPQGRFYTAITLNSGSDGETFGYTKAASGKDLNWVIVEPSAVIKVDKHVASRIFQPDELVDMDAYSMKYRKYGLVDVYENKTAGVAYCHKA